MDPAVTHQKPPSVVFNVSEAKLFHSNPQHQLLVPLLVVGYVAKQNLLFLVGGYARPVFGTSWLRKTCVTSGSSAPLLLFCCLSLLAAELELLAAELQLLPPTAGSRVAAGSRVSSRVSSRGGAQSTFATAGAPLYRQLPDYCSMAGMFPYSGKPYRNGNYPLYHQLMANYLSTCCAILFPYSSKPYRIDQYSFVTDGKLNKRQIHQDKYIK